ncbi:MAG TPA: TetR/AcrR family transcriptional regulator [bacterium]|jgi:AcrR family transcriptional regulator
MSSRREREKDERRKYILSKAQNLFASKGYRATSMAEIAEASEFAVGSLYSFFKSKDEILSTIFTEHIAYILEQTDNIRQDETINARDKMEKAVEELIKLYVNNQDFYKIYIGEARSVEWGVRTEVGEYIYEGTEKYLKIFSEIVKEAMAQGYVEESLDPEFLALILRNYIHSTVSHVIYSKKSIELEKMISITKRMLFNGISPQ